MPDSWSSTESALAAALACTLWAAFYRIHCFILRHYAWLQQDDLAWVQVM